ncbi:MAG TPA: hypothetical protein DCZ94_12195 [Lentisphaeria bacterium]|nr:MAG: hypothetical protein A2X48_12670 [Lentisphaerae bacterium GWF2_49_21]HBC87710.1 hypothetical protein [Lentisphaeria bacterium]
MIKKHFYILLVVLASAGFLLRLQVCRELLEKDVQVSRPSAGTDMQTYKELSETISKGEFNEKYYYQPFYYAVFLPVVHKVLGNGIWAVMIAQSVLSALTIFFAGLASAMLWGRRAGGLTALLTAFSAVLILYVPYHLIETLQAFWVILILYVAIVAWRSGKTVHWAITGFIVSLSILTRGNIWFFVPGLMIAAFFSVRIKSKEKPFWDLKNILMRLAPVAVFVIMVILPQVPFAARNTRLTGKLCGPSTAAGAVLALGNTPEAPAGGRNPGTGPGPMEYPETFWAWAEKAKEISETTRIFGWFKQEPLAFLELQWRKMLLFWDHREIPNNIAFAYQGMMSSTFKALAFVPTSLIMALALAWMLYFFIYHARKGFKRMSYHPRLLIISYLMIAFFFATAAFYILARFRLPCVPLLAVGAGGFAGVLMINLRRRDWRELIFKSVLPLFITSLIVFFGYDFYRLYYESSIMNIVRPNGIRTEAMGNKILYMDNGPVTFGSWTPVDIKEGDIIRKKFAVKDSLEGRIAEFALPFHCEVPGTVKLEVNGKSQQFEVKQGMNEQLFQIPFDLSASQVEIRFTFLDCKAYPLFDFQRNYGRTELNGKNPGAELVSKLYLAPRKVREE